MNNSDVNKAISSLKLGGVIVMPTDTVYGIVCSALDKDAVSRLFDIKKRVNKLGTILFSSERQLLDFGFDPALVAQAGSYWPGPVSVILPAPADRKYLAKNWNSLAVRIPELKWLEKMLEKTGPLATTSANMPDNPVVNSIDEAKDIFGDSIDFYASGGVLKSNPSKIIKINKDGTIEVLRK